MSSNADVLALDVGQMALADGAAYTFSPIAGRLALEFKLLSGGTLWFSGTAGLSMVSAPAWPLGANEIQAMDMRGPLTIYATGATCVFAYALGKTAGV